MSIFKNIFSEIMKENISNEKNITGNFENKMYFNVENNFLYLVRKKFIFKYKILLY